MKKFNTAGPSIAGDHYMIDPLARFDLPEIESLIDDKRYFVLHAPRQTGRTTSLLAADVPPQYKRVKGAVPCAL